MALARTQNIALLGAAAAALALAVALGSQHFMHLIPCPLCLRERWPYRIAIAAGLAGALLPRAAARVACWALVAIFIGAAAVASIHVGVEQQWWKSPLPECNGPDMRGLSIAERIAQMPALPGKSCEDKDYLIPAIPITMTQANMAYALLTAAGLTYLLTRQPKRAP